MELKETLSRVIENTPAVSTFPPVFDNRAIDALVLSLEAFRAFRSAVAKYRAAVEALDQHKALSQSLITDEWFATYLDRQPLQRRVDAARIVLAAAAVGFMDSLVVDHE